ncbi:Uma2 family endonuclease [Synechocystis sp. PCC 7509]|uniref:Uma2 family endonuclease n=1 Tax=Synechocystis sp. PCC 7509 TaxID=927677 RepID=UPI0002AC5738|nr:Uma2 family endonuclease [Synechocystis sp. PCC 7509]
MPQTSTVNLTIENYLTYDDGTDNRYELVDGAIVVVPLPSADHADKIDLLLEIFRAEIYRNNLSMKASDKVGVYIGKSSVTGRDYSRTPDICVTTSEAWLSLKANRTTAAVLLIPPILVVEVVSTNSEDDYVTKVDEYQRLGIPEYWIVDGRDKLVSVLLLNDGRYNLTEYRSSERIISRAFSVLTLTAAQVLSA